MSSRGSQVTDFPMDVTKVVEHRRQNERITECPVFAQTHQLSKCLACGNVSACVQLREPTLIQQSDPMKDVIPRKSMCVGENPKNLFRSSAVT